MKCSIYLVDASVEMVFVKLASYDKQVKNQCQDNRDNQEISMGLIKFDSWFLLPRQNNGISFFLSYFKVISSMMLFTFIIRVDKAALNFWK